MLTSIVSSEDRFALENLKSCLSAVINVHFNEPSFISRYKSFLRQADVNQWRWKTRELNQMFVDELLEKLKVYFNKRCEIEAIAA